MVEIGIVLALVVAAMVLFALERVPMEVTSLALVTMLALSGVLTPAEAFAGISSETVIFIFSLLAMTQGLASTGVMRLVGRRAYFIKRWGERPFLAGLLSAVAALSSLASNTAVAAAFLPVASSAATQAGIPRSRVLLPMAYASMLGGMILLYGTSTNLTVSAAMENLGMEPLGFAELMPVGLPAALLGIGMLVFLTPRLIPNRRTPDRAAFSKRVFVTEAEVVEGSRLVGSTMAEVADILDVELLGLVRERQWMSRRDDERIRAGDRLVIRGGTRTMLQLQDLRSLAVDTELAFSRTSEKSVLAEAFVPPHSMLVGRTLREAHFTQRFGLVPLAISRHPRLPAAPLPIVEARSLQRIRLAAGDVLLVSGPPRRLRELQNGDILTVLGNFRYRRPRYRRAALALGIFLSAVVIAATKLLAPPVAGLLGTLAMIATGCMDPRDAFRVEWRVVLLIGSLLALGEAMDKSGAGELLARGLLPVAESVGGRGILFLIMLATVGLSAPMSNQAAALVILPVAVNVARLLQLDPRAFAVGTALAASCSFLTPLEPAAALVYGPGHYRFVDFVRAGTPLTLVLLVCLTLAIPMVWPF